MINLEDIQKITTDFVQFLSTHLEELGQYKKTPLAEAIESIPDPLHGSLYLNYVHNVINLNAYPTIHRLLESKASLYDEDQQGRNYLHLIAAKNEPDLLRVFISRADQLLDYRDKLGYTPCHVAIMKDHAACLKVLLDSKADLRLTPTEKPFQKSPIMHFAAAKNAGKCIPLLLARGEQLEAPHDFWKETGKAVHCTPIATAVMCNSFNAVRCLLENKANVQFTFDDGSSLLHEVAFNKYSRTIHLLLENGLNVNQKTKDKGATPLMMAISQHGNAHNAQLLLLAKADVNEKDFMGNTALHHAVVKDHYPLIPLLISYRANPKLLNSYTQTPFELSRDKNPNSHSTQLLKITDLIRSCFVPGVLQALSDYIETDYIAKIKKYYVAEVILMDDESILPKLTKEAVDQTFDLIFKIGCEKLRTVLKDTLTSFLYQTYLYPRYFNMSSFAKPYIDVIVFFIEEKQWISQLPEALINLCIEYYPDLVAPVTGLVSEADDSTSPFTQKRVQIRQFNLIKTRMDYIRSFLKRREYNTVMEQLMDERYTLEIDLEDSPKRLRKPLL